MYIMRIDRFYIHPDERELRHELWINDKDMVHQWHNVLRLGEGAEVILFDGKQHERLYRVEESSNSTYKLAHVTDMEPKRPAKHLHVFWGLLPKRDKNELIVQKCTELGASVFTPIVTEHSEGKQFDAERAHKIAVEAAEQCGRIDIPRIHEPSSLEHALGSHAEAKLYFAHISDYELPPTEADDQQPIGVFIGPEGGWSEEEVRQFIAGGVEPLDLGDMVLRAETAAIAAVTTLMS